MKRKIEVWLLLLWFTGVEGTKIRDSWKMQERERIIKLWEQEMKCGCENAMQHLIELIRGETSE